MAGKYARLTEHLKQQAKAASTVTLSFGELKRILGFALPNSAINYRPWWANHRETHSHAGGWMDAGFVVETVNLSDQIVRFARRAPPQGKTSTKTLNEPFVAILKSTPSPTCKVNGCHLDLIELEKTARDIVRLAKADLGSVQTSWSLAPHTRSKSIPSNLQAVYCFFLGEVCLKVGKSGPGNNPRFVSHHYGVKSTSSLAKSILGNKSRVAKLLKEEMRETLQTLNEQTIGLWIEHNTSRLNLLLQATVGPHVLSLVEAYLQVRLNPVFEGPGTSEESTP